MSLAARGLGVVCLCLMGVAGCKDSTSVSASSAGSASDISGPPVMSAAFGTRAARVCAKVTSVPSAAEAVALVQCDQEGPMRNDLILVSDVVLEMGGPRAVTMNDSDINDLDSAAKVYPLRGTLKRYDCGPVATYGAGTNCQVWPAGPPNSGVGRCWHTLFGEWKCRMGGWGQQWVVKQPGPTAY